MQWFQGGSWGRGVLGRGGGGGDGEGENDSAGEDPAAADEANLLVLFPSCPLSLSLIPPPPPPTFFSCLSLFTPPATASLVSWPHLASPLFSSPRLAAHTWRCGGNPSHEGQLEFFFFLLSAPRKCTGGLKKKIKLRGLTAAVREFLFPLPVAASQRACVKNLI